MEHLPPVGWADVATKHDLEQFAAATKRDLDQLAVATNQDLAHLEERFDQRLEATKHELIGMLRGELSSQGSAFRAELNAQTRTMLLTMSTLIVTLAALAFTAARLI